MKILEKRLGILQNIQKRTNLEGQLKPARGQMAKCTEYLQSDKTGAK